MLGQSCIVDEILGLLSPRLLVFAILHNCFLGPIFILGTFGSRDGIYYPK